VPPDGVVRGSGVLKDREASHREYQ
jgi:hypothetical protein